MVTIGVKPLMQPESGVEKGRSLLWRLVCGAAMVLMVALYAAPATTFCARFIGTPPMNLIAASDLPGFAHMPMGSLVGVRPEDMVTDANGVEARVESVEYLGADQPIAARIGDARIIVRQPARTGAPDATVRLSWPAEATHLFDADGRRLT